MFRVCCILFTLASFFLHGCAHQKELPAHVPVVSNMPGWTKDCNRDLDKGAICEIGYAEVLAGESYLAEEEARLIATEALTKKLENRLVVLLEKTETLKNQLRSSKTRKHISELAMTQLQGVRTDRRFYSPNRVEPNGVYVRVWLIPDDQQLQSSLEEMFEVLGKEPVQEPAEVEPEAEPPKNEPELSPPGNTPVEI